MSTTMDPDYRPFYELTAEEQSVRADECKVIESRIKGNMKVTREALWRLAEDLHEFHLKSGWSALGFDKQEEWLAQPDIGIHRQDYFNLRRMYNVMRLQRGMEMEQLVQLEHSKVRIALPAIEEERAPLETIIEHIKTLPASELREEYVGSGIRGMRGGPPAASNGGQPDGVVDGQPDDDGVVDATAVDVPEPPPVAPEPELDVDDKLVHAATVVDSWLEMGGDRRKAIRNWKTFVERHPVLEAVRQIQKLMDGEDDAPDRDTAGGMWAYLRAALAVTIDDGTTS